MRTINADIIAGPIKFDPFDMSIEETNFFYSLHNKMGSSFNDDHVREYSNHLQVTVRN